VCLYVCGSVSVLIYLNKNSSGDEIVNVNFYAVCPEATRGTSQKLIYDFLLVVNTNLPPIAPFPRYSRR